MPGLVQRLSIVRLAFAAVLAAALVGGVIAVPEAGAAGLPRWTGSVDLYRSGAFTTQKSWLWCTAADVQIMRNIVDRKSDHSKANQRRYFDYMRDHNRYDIPEKDGVDPAGWAAGLRHYVDGRYELTASRSFDAALRASVINLRRTSLPVGITVAHGSHAWVLTGFSATADPATTDDFTVTSVRVVGPLWGLQSREYGYDMKPATKLTVKQFKGFFTPWHYGGVKMAWEGRYVSIQPVAGDAAPSRATSKPTPTPKPTATSTPKPTATSTPKPTPIATPIAPTSPGSEALVRPPATARDTPVPSPPASSAATRATDVAATWIVLILAGVVATGAVALGLSRRHPRRR